jgi:hypothetical protein
MQFRTRHCNVGCDTATRVSIGMRDRVAWTVRDVAISRIPARRRHFRSASIADIQQRRSAMSQWQPRSVILCDFARVIMLLCGHVSLLKQGSHMSNETFVGARDMKIDHTRNDQLTNSQPSSDLLSSIHQLASEYRSVCQFFVAAGSYLRRQSDCCVRKSAPVHKHNVQHQRGF